MQVNNHALGIFDLNGCTKKLDQVDSASKACSLPLYLYTKSFDSLHFFRDKFYQID